MTNLNKTPFDIKLKQGVAANINAAGTTGVASVGEPHWTTDTDQLYVFNGTENVPIGASLPIATKTADYTATATDYTILCDATSNTVTITLPTAVGIAGRQYNIKCINATYTVTIDGNGAETIDTSATQTLVLHESMTIVSDGTNWWII